jgi:hypothetical protein
MASTTTLGPRTYPGGSPPRPVRSPTGEIYPSITLAAQAAGVPVSTMSCRCSRRSFGWAFVDQLEAAPAAPARPRRKWKQGSETSWGTQVPDPAPRPNESSNSE